jgi:cysteinyl-tRNA synthetase
MKARPDGRKRIVLSYFSIGEAESYRYYWKNEWAGDQVPGWYVAENCAWPRNYMVRFWHDGWKDIIYRGADSFLARIVAAGFDGVYLDRMDVFWELLKERPSAREDMIRFVTEIAETGRRLKPGFLVVAQNAEDLLEEARYRDVIDGLGKEDLFYGQSGTNTRNPEGEIAQSVHHIRRLQRDWKPVFAVEYVTEAALVEAAKVELQRLGMVPTVAHRSLDGHPPTHHRPPSGIKYGTPEWINEQCKDKRHW